MFKAKKVRVRGRERIDRYVVTVEQNFLVFRKSKDDFSEEFKIQITKDLIKTLEFSGGTGRVIMCSNAHNYQDTCETIGSFRYRQKNVITKSVSNSGEVTIYNPPKIEVERDCEDNLKCGIEVVHTMTRSFINVIMVDSDDNVRFREVIELGYTSTRDFHRRWESVQTMVNSIVL